MVCNFILQAFIDWNGSRGALSRAIRQYIVFIYQKDFDKSWAVTLDKLCFNIAIGVYLASTFYSPKTCRQLVLKYNCISRSRYLVTYTLKITTLLVFVFYKWYTENKQKERLFSFVNKYGDTACQLRLLPVQLVQGKLIPHSTAIEAAKFPFSLISLMWLYWRKFQISKSEVVDMVKINISCCFQRFSIEYRK